nr:UDP-N-acetylglucosamine 2-epimerase (non-hydrolyzing) [Sphingomonas sp. Y57]
MKILTVIGARPQFIKAASVSRQIDLRDGVTEIIVHTGQHYDANMSDIFFEELSIPRPDHYLGIGGGSHGAMTGRQLEAIETVLLDERPDIVLVYGDTNSTLAGALAAVKLHIPVAHVEAGLRSFNRRMPEEINRILTDHASDFLFAPTETAVANMRAEGLSAGKIHLVGDVMCDAAIFYKDKAYPPAWFRESGVEQGAFVLATVHRAENTDDPRRLRAILDGLATAKHPVILPWHPRTQARVKQFGIDVDPKIKIVEPVGYLEMVWLETNSAFIATDSGGVQKEAYFHNKYCIILRDETEWIELTKNGCNVLVGADRKKISYAIQNYDISNLHNNIYGYGNSSSLICDIIFGTI